MKKRILVGLSMIAVLVGCGQQPEIDIDAGDQNITKVNKATQESIKPLQKIIKVEEVNNTDNNNMTEEDLTDTSAVAVSNESLNDTNDYQKLASSLSKEVVHFDFDKYNIKNNQMPIVQEVANLLKDNKGNYTVRIEGNCDEWGSDEYNYALGLKRAKVVKNALIDLGVDKNKLTIISYGESNPVCTAHNKECWAKNRRDNFTLLP